MSHDLFLNRELSWIAFNERVLYECFDSNLPLSDRLKFSAIFSNNLDEFYMIRVGGLIDQVFANYSAKDYSGMRPKEQLHKIRQRVLELTSLQSNITKTMIDVDLRNLNINIVGLSELNDLQNQALERYYTERIFPVLTPMAIDFGRPFPLVLNKSLNIIAKFQADEDKYVAIQVPSVLPRLVPIACESDCYLLLEDVIVHFLGYLFDGLKPVKVGQFRVTRNGDLSLQGEVAEDLLSVIEQSLRQRKWGEVIRLEVNAAMDEAILEFLKTQLEIDSDDVYRIEGTLDLTWLFQLVDIASKQENHTKHTPMPFPLNQESIFEAISREDILLHHPFDSFDPVVHFIETAANDPDVLAIKQVLYRVGGDSPIVKALQRAASAGKQVTVLVELMARFDEENNILWAKALEQHGCHVIYGLEGIKTHAKIALVVRNEGDGIQRYVHLSTGNYNDKTAKIYTDISLFTCHEQIAQDASKFFNTLTGYVNYIDLHLLISAPHHLKKMLIQLIETEIYWANQGRPARIVAKMNSLVDSEVINALYKASSAGVTIDLIVRGICCLIPSKKGLSENIRVISVIGNYLEHTRVFYFHNNGDEKCFISSADWMPRNLIKRVELMTPIEHPKNKEYLKKMLELYLTTSKKTHQLTATGHYISLTLDDQELSVQQQLERRSSLLWLAM